MSEKHVGFIARTLRRLETIGNHDFCPWANRYVYWLKQPIGWFVVGLAAATLIALFLEPQAWILVGSLLAVMLMGVVWPWVAMRGASAEIRFGRRRCREGDRVQVRLAVHNRYPWSLWGLAVENGFFLDASESGERPVAALARVPGWSNSEFTFEFRPKARGVYPHKAPELATGFPFGIWRASQKIAVSRELLAWPRTTPLRSIPSLDGDIAEVTGMLFDRPGNEGDVIGVRPFREGDRLRSIHWAQTSRHNAFIVTERQAAARQLVVLAVDLEAFTNSGSSSDGAGQRRHLETAIRAAASIAQEFHAHHAEVRFVIGDIDMHLTPDAVGLRRLMDSLARFQVDPGVARPPSRFGHKELAVVITTSERRLEFENRAEAKRLLRLVLIETPASSNGTAATKGRSRNVWITLDPESDSSLQLRQQWERVCHDNSVA